VSCEDAGPDCTYDLNVSSLRLDTIARVDAVRRVDVAGAADIAGSLSARSALEMRVGGALSLRVMGTVAANTIAISAGSLSHSGAPDVA
jgi:hypothetical protein